MAAQPQDNQIPTPNPSVALEFLRQLRPEGPWLLTAISSAERRRPETRAFQVSEPQQATDWLVAMDAERRNVYYHVNPASDPAVQSKLEKADVGRVEYLHIDVDPRAGEDLAAEQVRILGLLTEKLPAGVPKPTAVVLSGAGVNALWKLEQPITLDSTEPTADEAGLYNKWLATVGFSGEGDAVHDVSRILRLPGTVNYPDEKKRKRGRVPALARQVWFESKLVYPLSRFKKAEGTGGKVVAFTPPAAERRVGEISELDAWSVPDRIKIAIVQGRHPDEPKEGDNSRSAWVFDVTCNLVRCGVPDDVILGILMDATWAISESVLELKRNAKKYATRQIERAHVAVFDPVVAELNRRYFVVRNHGGQVRVCENVKDGTARSHFSMRATKPFAEAYCNDLIEIKKADGTSARINRAKYWLASPHRREYERIVFLPSEPQEVPGEWGVTNYNLWQGWGVQPQQGDWSLMREHIRSVLADGNPEYDEYILNWAAWAVANPEKVAEVALVLIGGQGTGKSLFGRAMVDLFGQHAITVTAGRLGASQFNSELQDVALILGDEAVRSRDVKAINILKTLISDPEMIIESKGVNAFSAPNHLKVILTSNEKSAVFLDQDDRRYAVFEVGGQYAQNREYFGRLAKQLEQGGLGAMLHDLLAHGAALNERRWHPAHNIPNTRIRNEQKAHSLSGFEAVMYDLLQSGELPDLGPGNCRVLNGGYVFVATSALHDWAYNERRCHAETITSVARFLTDRLGFQKHDSSRPRGRLFPPLPEARTAWDRVMSPADWAECPGWSPCVGMGDARREVF